MTYTFMAVQEDGVWGITCPSLPGVFGVGKTREAAVQAVNNSYYETLEELAAAYAVYIVQGHVFMNGNKRTASASMLTFLVANNKKPKLSMKDTASIMLELQQRVDGGERMDSDLLIRWIAGFL